MIQRLLLTIVLGFSLQVQGKAPASKEEALLLKARTHYGKGQYQKALEAYNKIGKSSKHWLAAVEERAWSHVQLGQINEAIADTHTLMSPLFIEAVSPEAFHVSAFASHQICDFNRVFEIIEKFKKISQPKIVSLEAKVNNRRRDGNYWRLKHYASVIQQLHLIEADAIQRLYLDKQLAGKRAQAGPRHKAGAYDLQFPYDENDVWVDEIDSLKVDAKNCPTLLRKVVSK